MAYDDKRLRALASSLAVVAAVSCGDAGDEGMGDGTEPPPPADAGTPPPTDGGGVIDAEPLPPEQELESSYGAPVATGKFVWIPTPPAAASPTSTRPRSRSLVEAGNGPTHVAAVPDEDGDVALVLNVLSQDVTLLRAKADLPASRSGAGGAATRWAVSTDGHWAIAWTDAPVEAPIASSRTASRTSRSRPRTREATLHARSRRLPAGRDRLRRRRRARLRRHPDGIGVVGLTRTSPRSCQHPVGDNPLEDVYDARRRR